MLIPFVATISDYDDNPESFLLSKAINSLFSDPTVFVILLKSFHLTKVCFLFTLRSVSTVSNNQEG